MKLLLGAMTLPLWCGCTLSTNSPSHALHTEMPHQADMNNKQALIVLDMQNDFCHEDGKMHGLVVDELMRTDIVASTLRLIEAAQAKGVPTIVLPIEFDYSQPGSAVPEGIAAPIVEQRAFDRDGFGGELIEEVEQLIDEKNVLKMSKPGLSAFAGTELNRVLNEKQIEEVVIAGLLTNLCVENTARDAFDLGYRVRVVSDATATFDAKQQAYAMETIFPMLGRVITVDEFSAMTASGAR